MGTQTTDLWILGGFLGSGKTSLLNRLLASMQSIKVGVVVNDFGKLGVDAELIENSNKNEIIELNGGQIFCSCISGNFVRSVTGLSEKEPDVILVESSGLAKPSALSDIMDEVLHKTEEKICYRGFLAVVDAERSGKLMRAVNAVEEQIRYADLVVLNKIDLVSAEQIQNLREEIYTVNSEAELVETSYGELSIEELPNAPLAHDFSSTEYNGWGEAGRPKAITWKPDIMLSEIQLTEAVRFISSHAYRLKGYLTTKEGLRFVSASGKQVSIEAVERPHEKVDKSSLEEGIVVIVAPQIAAGKLFKEALQKRNAYS